jgi:hypothetical protein
MAYDGHAVIDADSHIREYWNLDRTYGDYIDPEYREHYKQLSEAVRARQRPGMGDVGLNFIWPLPAPRHPMGIYDSFLAPPEGEAPSRVLTTSGIEIDHSCNWDPAIRLRDMDTAQIDVSVMFPSQSDGFCAMNDVGFESALHRAYHRYMANYCAESEGRLRWVADASVRDIPETVAQLRYWVEHDPNFAGMFIPRALPDGSMLDNPNLHPLFAASQELDMPIWVHGGANRPPYTPWLEAPNALYHGLGGMYALAGLIGGGVFDKFPKLRIGLFESGAGWMPYLIEKLDDGYHPGSKTTPFLKRKPSEIVASGQFFCAVEAEEEHLEYAVEDLGEDIWLFSTDYPHGGTCWPNGVPLITERAGLSESAKIKMLGENAKRFLPSLG